MTEFRNAVFIRHEIRHQGVSGAGSYMKETKATLGRAFDYISREGAFSVKGGVDHEPTLEDRQLEARKASLANTLHYIERTGAYEGRGQEKPMAAGEVSGGALWGPSGLVDPDSFIDEVIGSGSNVVHSIFTVSREWAERLHLSTKAEFQTFLRGNWQSFIDSWGVIPKGRGDWCAEFHTDADRSVHCHIITYDRSGTFTGAKQIPHDVIETSKQEIRKAAFSEYQAEKNAIKDMARSLMLNQIRLSLGLQVSSSVRGDLERKALETGMDLHLSMPSEERRAELEGKLAGIAALLPESGRGRLGAYSVSKEAREAARALLAEMEASDPVLSAALGAYRSSVETASDILGKTGRFRDSYIEKHMDDLETRSLNSILRAAGTLNSPWKREGARRGIFLQAVEAGKAAMTRDAVLISSDERDLAEFALRNGAFREKVAELTDLLSSSALGEGGREMSPEQERRLINRMREDLSTELRKAARWKIASKERLEQRREGFASARTAVHDLLRGERKLEVTEDVRKEFELSFRAAVEELSSNGAITDRTLTAAARPILRIPAVRSSIRNAAFKEATLSGRRIEAIEPRIARERMEQTKAIIERSAQSEVRAGAKGESVSSAIIASISAPCIGSGHESEESRALAAAHRRLSSGQRSRQKDRTLGN